MTAFAIAAAALFRDPNIAVDALYRPGGTGSGVSIRVVFSSPDQLAAFGEGRFVTDTVLIAVRVADAPDLAESDTVEINGTLYTIRGAPVRDADRLVWSAEARAL
ncbi:hypothetical protein [Phenylobacterium sp.]|uniref:head-tail joining protein n=1 Tax=Phenylobacterium sp. TaxID=1871053 RepID=UPI0025DC1E8E|nr:hypothetical protein [Phenylobacterium sp.]MCA3512576.1 hypothetical protein [Rhodobacter sp.]MCA3521287.1 hypothetical protein [Rhodobacter sp.]MCA3550965.1 hypothetical protein [Rhodobacter sp.]MCA6262198.1 hypothetical protein [Phenylobacterium sp.]MCA6281234.1 hypothetical protein [Phenylobacterium sp.]